MGTNGLNRYSSCSSLRNHTAAHLSGTRLPREGELRNCQRGEGAPQHPRCLGLHAGDFQDGRRLLQGPVDTRGVLGARVAALVALEPPAPVLPTRGTGSHGASHGKRNAGQARVFAWADKGANWRCDLIAVAVSGRTWCRGEAGWGGERPGASQVESGTPHSTRNSSQCGAGSGAVCRGVSQAEGGRGARSRRGPSGRGGGGGAPPEVPRQTLQS